MSVTLFDQEKELANAKLTFVETIASRRSYFPSLALYKGGKPVIQIICRYTKDSFEDQHQAFNEMLASIMGVDPDYAVFTADTFFDIKRMLRIDEDSQYYDEKNVEKTGISAYYSIVGRKYGNTELFLEPYGRDNNCKIWWFNTGDFANNEAIFGETKPLVIDPIVKTLDRMFSLQGSLPMKTSKLFDILTGMGHVVRLMNNYFVE